MFDKKRTPTLKKIKEEIQCLIGYHKHCVRHYKTGGSTHKVYCRASGKFIKGVHPEDSPVKIRFSKKDDLSE